MSNLTGKTILHYEIIEELGRGGMGVVYKAHDTKLNRDVAIKFLPGHICKDCDERERFKFEAQAAAALNHPNIATIHSIEEVDDEVFIVMEYIAGQELKDVLRDNLAKVSNLRKVTSYATQIVEGLAAAHKHGIIHRDIKPANIMLTNDERIKIMDFGLAQIAGRDMLDSDNGTMGTVNYMAPEQVQGSIVDARTDIWTMGVLLYEMLTGREPFHGDYEQAIFYSILNKNPAPLSTGATDAYPDLKRIVFKCLNKEPGKRYPSADALLAELQHVQSQLDGGDGRTATAAAK